MASGLPAPTERNVFAAFDRFTALAQMYMERENVPDEQKQRVNDALADGHRAVRELRITKDKENTKP